MTEFKLEAHEPDEFEKLAAAFGHLLAAVAEITVCAGASPESYQRIESAGRLAAEAVKDHQAAKQEAVWDRMRKNGDL